MSPVPDAQPAALRARWSALCRAFTEDAALAADLFLDLAQRYGENGRFYHTLTHVAAVLRSLDPLDPPPALRFAAWFHDVVYEPLRPDNEARSADHAAAQLARLGVPGGVIARVQELIWVTKSHEPAAGDGGAMALVDADLAILGAETAVYEQYTRAIRREYAQVPDVAYRIGRQQVLHQFLARPRIYHTEAAFTTYETRARANLRRELAELED